MTTYTCPNCDARLTKTGGSAYVCETCATVYHQTQLTAPTPDDPCPDCSGRCVNDDGETCEACFGCGLELR